MKLNVRQAVGLVALPLIVLYFARPAWVYYTSPPEADQSKCLLEGRPNDPRLLPRPSASGTVKIIQLSDVGEFIDRCQFTDTLYELNWHRTKDADGDFNAVVKPGAIAKTNFVVLYVHGWHNNARSDTGDLPEFRNLMSTLATSNPEKQVVGIYVSWEANSDIPIWHYLDFWQKEAVADRIAASGNLTNIISAASNILSQSKEGGRLISIGHSFGARILMASTIQNIIIATQKAHPGRPNAEYKSIEGISQTTIFLNPAFDAAYFTPINAFNRREEHFSQDQKPVLLSIATADDNATTYAFPFGQWLAWQTTPKQTHTLGNFKPFWTHSLDISSDGSCSDVDQVGGLTERYQLGNVCLKRTNGYPHNPFMVIRAEPIILSGHNGIWDKKFSNWLFSYVDELGKQLPPKTPTN